MPPATQRDLDSAVTVKPGRIARLSEPELGELMRELLHTHAARCGSPASSVIVNGEGGGRDGGCDAWTERPPVSDDWLGDVATCWQLKAGTAGEPARLRGEVVKPMPRQSLQDGNRYVLIAAGCTGGVDGERKRRSRLVEEATEAGIPTDRIDVYGSERLAQWCNEHPTIAGRLNGLPRGLKLQAEWEAAPDHQVPWEASEATRRELETLRAALAFDTGAVQHLHLRGSPGAGRTRHALELCRGAAWGRCLFYADRADRATVEALIDCAVRLPTVRVVVVADWVPQHDLRPLRDALDRAGGRVRLITIGESPTTDATRIHEVAVPACEHGAIWRIVRTWYPAMPCENVNFVVSFADQYVRLAKLAADAVNRRPGIDVRTLLDRGDIGTFLREMVGESDLQHLHVVAALSDVGWTGAAQDEGQAVANHLGVDWPTVQARVNALNGTYRIAPQRGNYRIVSPPTLGNYLAKDAWSTYPDRMKSLRAALPTPRAQRAFDERWRLIATPEEAVRYTQAVLRNFQPADQRPGPESAWHNAVLSQAPPNKVAARIHSLLRDPDNKDLTTFAGSTRRHLVASLVHPVTYPEAFEDAAHALALLAEAENEPWSNNATAEFCTLYQVNAGRTAVPYLDRLEVLGALVERGSTRTLELVVRALAQFNERQPSGTALGMEFSASFPTPWRPSTEDEYRACLAGAVEVLTRITRFGAPMLEAHLVDACANLSHILALPLARPLVAQLFAAVRAQYPGARERLRRHLAARLGEARKSPGSGYAAAIAELEAMHDEFSGHTLLDRLMAVVGTPRWERDGDPDLRPFARELAASPEQLQHALTLLVGSSGTDAWQLGVALADCDPQRHHLELLQSDDTANDDPRVLCGYASALRATQGDSWYDTWFEEQARRFGRSNRRSFELAWRCGATPDIVRSIDAGLRLEAVPESTVGLLSEGDLVRVVTADLLGQLVDTLVETNHHATALRLVESRLRSHPDESQSWEYASLVLLGHTPLIRSNASSHDWSMLASHFAERWAAEIAGAIIDAHGYIDGRAWFVRDSCIEPVLIDCAERNPERVADALEAALATPDRAPNLAFGFQNGLLERLPRARVLSWFADDPERAASIVVRMMTPDFSTDDTLASQVIARFGDHDDVASATLGAYSSGSCWGPFSAHWTQLAESLMRVAKRHSAPERLRRWAIASADELDDRADYHRRHE